MLRMWLNGVCVHWFCLHKRPLNHNSSGVQTVASAGATSLSLAVAITLRGKMKTDTGETAEADAEVEAEPQQNDGSKGCTRRHRTWANQSCRQQVVGSLSPLCGGRGTGQRSGCSRNECRSRNLGPSQTVLLVPCAGVVKASFPPEC